MLTRSIHAPSLLIGVLGVAVVLLSMSQIGTHDPSARVEYGPHPRDMVQIREGTPVVVPVGKLFVLAGLGSVSDQINLTTLRVNGVPEARSYTQFSSVGTQLSIGSVPTGFTVVGGATIEAVDSLAGQDARAWGYLAKQ